MAAIDGTPFLNEKESQWLANKELPFAVDLVSAATVLGESSTARGAAEFILENGSGVSLVAQQLARGLLGIAVPAKESVQPISRQRLIHDVKELKARRLTQSRNAFVWADLARLYVLLGQIEPARQAIRIAINLAPAERFVLRSATRFLLHSKDHEQALHLLRSNPRTPVDPWLTAAEIAVSSVVGKTPKFVRRGQELLKSADVPPFHTSELASALASLEMFEGNNRKANKLFIKSLKEPTDNALAQVVWASKRTGLGVVNSSLLQRPNSSEAKTFDAYNRAQWSDVVIHANTWSQHEAFSARPRLLASAVAASLLDEPELSEKIARSGLEANPGDAALINNIAFALIEQGKPEEALKELSLADKNRITPVEAICLIATTGLAYFRVGAAEDGRRYYEAAIEAATRHNNQSMKALAKLYLARELVLQKNPDGFKEFRKAHEEAKKFQNTNLPHIADHLAEKVMDAEIKQRPTA